MAAYRIILKATIISAILGLSYAASAQVIVIPDCNLQPTHPFCQGQCSFDPGLPWCNLPGPERDPIILIPGITVSQNKKLMYKDDEGGKWKFAPFFNVYKGLVKKLESAGYEEGVDFFVAHYDWRYGAQHNADKYLKPMVDTAKSTTGASKVDVIAHSFGGVVTRAYIQGEEYGQDIDQLITIGSPHEGSADSYVAWEGGLFPEGWNFLVSRTVGNVEEALKETRHLPDIQRPESFRAFFPSLQDMLPINPFVKKDGELQAPETLAAQNSFLKSLWDSVSNITNGAGVRLTTVAGTNLNTLGTVTLTNTRTDEDRALNRWRDGHAAVIPPPLDSSAGDGRVLYDDATIGDDTVTIENVAHHRLPDEAQDQVFEKLGLAEADTFWSDFPDNIFGIVILSPLQAEITGPTGQVLSPTQNGFAPGQAEYDDDPDDPDDPIEINIANLPAGQYAITYTGTGTGEYTVITSYADQDELETDSFSGRVTPGQTFTSTFNLTAAGPDNFKIIQPDTSQPPFRHGRGDEQDCCTGPDPAPGPVRAKARVLGAQTAASPYRRLVPVINRLHRQAFGRNPSYQEHIY